MALGEFTPIFVPDLQEADKGRMVTYHASHGAKEHGFLSSWNHVHIFVVFDSRNAGQGVGCDPEDCSFTFHMEKSPNV